MIVMVCDECKADFTVFRPGVEIVKDDIERTYFACPSCNKDYTVCYTNDGIRSMQRMIQGLVGGKGKKNVRLRLDLKKRIEIGMNRLEKEVVT